MIFKIGETVRVHQKSIQHGDTSVHWDVNISEILDTAIKGTFISSNTGLPAESIWFFNENEIEILNGRVH